MLWYGMTECLEAPDKTNYHIGLHRRCVLVQSVSAGKKSDNECQPCICCAAHINCSATKATGMYMLAVHKLFYDFDSCVSSKATANKQRFGDQQMSDLPSVLDSCPVGWHRLPPACCDADEGEGAEPLRMHGGQLCCHHGPHGVPNHMNLVPSKGVLHAARKDLGLMARMKWPITWTWFHPGMSCMQYSDTQLQLLAVDAGAAQVQT